MKCPACNTENRDDAAGCYQCQADLTILQIVINRAKQHYNNGLERAERGRISEAIEELKKAVELNAKHLPSHNVLGTLYAKKGLYSEAIAEWKAALAIDPSAKKAHEYIQQALELSQTPILKKKLNLTKNLAGLFILLFILALGFITYFLYLDRLYLSGEKALADGKYHEAYDILNQVMHNKVSTTMARGAKLAISQIDTQLKGGLNNIEQKKQLKKYEEGLELCNRMLKMSLPDIWAEKVLAQKTCLLTAIVQREIAVAKESYEQNGNYAKALETIYQLQNRYPESASIPEFNIEFGKLQNDWFTKQIQEIDRLRRGKNYEKASQLANQLLEKKPMLDWQKKLQTIITTIKKEKTQAEYDLIASSIKAQQFEIAYTRLTAIEVTNLNSTQQVWLTTQLPNIKTGLARQYWKDIGDQTQVIFDQKLDAESAKQIIRKSGFISTAVPEASYADDALFYKGFAQEQLKQWNDAIATYEQIAKQYPKSSFTGNAAYRIGYGYEQLKQYDKAIMQYKKVMEQYPKGSYPGNPTARIKAIQKLTINKSQAQNPNVKSMP
ncbi:MAG: tetratricopeptide repeat protein [bacterium]|nr:tetratricopeptide repeat protein [bacterium]